MENANRTQAAGAHYRADIDGLRAVAVVPVVLYHFHVPGFSGGFVGVDVFFVISGFLITALIHAEMLENRFSIVSFYERRVRRIFPCLFFLLAGVTLLSFPILFPGDFARYARSLIATTLFSSNFLFWNEAGYFDAAASVKPLLHTWSLAVEEQFYLVYPAILFVLRKSSKTVLLSGIAALLLVSFVISEVGVALQPSATFYLLPSRMWELMFGAMLALGAVPASRSKVLRDVLGAAGLLFIAAATVLYSQETPFPGAAAALPCLGAGLVIYAGSQGPSLTSSMLSARLPVFIGLISYSLYLWHWPLFVLGSYYTIQGLNVVQTCALIALSFALAWFSYRYVEQPFRGKAGILSRHGIFRAAGLAMVCSAMVAFVIGYGHGLPQRFDQSIVALVGKPERDFQNERCFRSAGKVASGALCRLGDARAPVTFILWGDSHAGALIPGLDQAAAHKGVAGLFAGHPGCAPLVGVTRVGSLSAVCRAFNDAVVELLRKRREIREVVLMARWSREALGTTYGTQEQAEEKFAWIVDDQSATASFDENKAVFARGMERTLRTLAGLNKKIILVGPVPEVSWRVPETLAKLKRIHSTLDIRPSVDEYQARQNYVLHVIAALHSTYSLKLVYPSETLCGLTRCEVEKGGRPLYSDEDHLSRFGAQQLAPALGSALLEG